MTAANWLDEPGGERAHRRRSGRKVLAVVNRSLALASAALLVTVAAKAQDWTVIGWNNLGMHCMDPDYSVFALLPPYNTLEAQVIDADGHLVRAADGASVTYEATADPDGSRNSTSIGKTNFWDFAPALFGVALPPDVGLAGAAMPGADNVPQPLGFHAEDDAFRAEGIPITPHDDAGNVNSYPLMHVVARDADGSIRASTDVVLPVSEELNCRACHISDGSLAAQPAEGWVHDPDPERDTRLNILLLHDDRNLANPTYDAALATAGYDAAGLYATATAGHPILCARCHLTNALPGSGIVGISPLTQAVHRRMALVLDPLTGALLDDVNNRSACYRCHPGSVTRCLRGAMGAAVAADGTLAIQCQSCHGSMRDLAATGRTGWLDEPNCQSCHTGTAVNNNGQIRYLTVFDSDGTPRQAIDQTFATTADTPAPGFSLFRYSIGHGGLRCEACHGPTHAEYPSLQANDNLQSEQLQGHVGVLADCTACHATTPSTVDGGPHGMHPIGAGWLEAHQDAADEGGATRCQACHGLDYRGTVLSRAQGERILDTDFGRKDFWRGFEIGCYTCHRGPGGGEANPNRAPVCADGHAVTLVDAPVAIALDASDPDGDGLNLRIVDQGQHGTVGLDGATARYIPETGFTGQDTFTFTASDGSTDGNLASVTVTVGGALCAGDCNGDGQVEIDELVRGIDIALDLLTLDQCPVFDGSGDGTVTIDELVRAITAALHGC
jgi:hypothetical protein